jgi:hypothetical protein
MWTVWHEKNSRIFENEQSLMDQLLGNFDSTLFDWSRVWGFTTVATVSEFVVSLLFDFISIISL